MKILRSVFSARDITAFRVVATRMCYALDTGSFTGETLRQTYEEWGGLPFDQVLKFLDASVTDPLRAAIATASGIEEALPMWRSEMSFFRRLRAPVPWHCDAEAASTLKLAPACTIVWVPLDQVGRDAPGLELIEGSDELMRERNDRPLPPNLHRSDAFADAIHGRRLAPVLDPGDALVFNHFHLHRTQLIPGERTNVELRFT